MSLLLRGTPPDGRPALSYIKSPQGGTVGGKPEGAKIAVPLPQTGYVYTQVAP